MRFFVGASDKSPGQKAVQAMLLTILNPSYESGKHMLDSQDRHTMTALNLGSCFELVTCHNHMVQGQGDVSLAFK